MVNIIIADNSPVLIEGIIGCLKGEPKFRIIESAVTGKELLKKLKRETPNIVMLETNMPDIPGIDLAKVIQKKHKNVKVVFYTEFEDSFLIMKSIKAGAKAYLIKNITKEELIFSIKKVAEGDVDFFYKTGSQ